MAIAVSKFKINQTLPKRGQIKIKIFKMIAKSLTNLANGVAGEKMKAAGNGQGSGGSCSSTATVFSAETVGGYNTGSKHAIKQNRPRRGKITVKIFKMFAKSFKDLAIGVAGGKKKDAGIGQIGGGCFRSPATVIPVEIMGEFESASAGEIKKTDARTGQIKIKIKIWKLIVGSHIKVSESGGKNEAVSAGGDCLPAAGILPMEL